MAITLTVETGSASSISNCYASIAQTTAYFVQRGITGWETFTTEQLKPIIIRAAQYLDIQYPWVGYKTARNQAMEWPRQVELPQYPYYSTNQIATGIIGPGGWEVGTTQIPTEVVRANCELTARFMTQVTIIADQDRLTKREKVGDIEVEYLGGAVNAQKRFPVVDKLLKGLYQAQGQISFVRV